MVTMQCHVLGVVHPAAARAGLAGRGPAASRLRPRDRCACCGSGAAAARDHGGGLPPPRAPRAADRLHRDAGDPRLPRGRRPGCSGTGLFDRLGMVGLRSVAWPLAGLVTDRIALAILAAAAAVIAGVVVATWRSASWPTSPGASAGGRRCGGCWRRSAWSILALAVFAPSLATVTPGLPNDHYHAFLDPLVLAMAGVGLARSRAALDPGACRRAGCGRDPGRGGPRRGCSSWSGDGMAAARGRGRRLAAGRRGGGAGGAGRRAGATVLLDGIPPFKSDGRAALPAGAARRVPAARHGSATADGSAATGPVILVCDPLFEEVVGRGVRRRRPRTRWLAGRGAPRGLRLVDRFDAGPRRVISVYAPAHALTEGPGAPDAVAAPGAGMSPNRERRPLQTGVRCPRDPDVEGRPGSCPDSAMDGPACGRAA